MEEPPLFTKSTRPQGYSQQLGSPGTKDRPERRHSSNVYSQHRGGLVQQEEPPAESQEQ